MVKNILFRNKTRIFGSNCLALKTKTEYFGKELLTDQEIKKIVINSGEIKSCKKWLKEEKGKVIKITPIFTNSPPTADLSDLNTIYENYKRKTYDSYLK